MNIFENNHTQMLPATDVETCKRLTKANVRVDNKTLGSTYGSSSSDGRPPIMKIQSRARHYQDKEFLTKVQKELCDIGHPNSYDERTAATTSMSVSFITSSDSEEVNHPKFTPQPFTFDLDSDSDTDSDTASDTDSVLDHNYEFKDNTKPELNYNVPSQMDSKENMEPGEERMGFEHDFSGSTEEVAHHNRMKKTVNMPFSSRSKDFAEPELAYDGPQFQLECEQNVDSDKNCDNSAKGFNLNDEENAEENEGTKIYQSMPPRSSSHPKEFVESDLAHVLPLFHWDFEEDSDSETGQIDFWNSFDPPAVVDNYAISEETSRLTSFSACDDVTEAEMDRIQENEGAKIYQSMPPRSSSHPKEFVESDLAHVLPLFHWDFEEDSDSETDQIDFWNSFDPPAVVDNYAISEETSRLTSFSACDDVTEAEMDRIHSPSQLDTKENNETEIKGVHRKENLRSGELLNIFGNCTNDIRLTRTQHLYEYGVKSIMLKREVEFIQRLRRNRKEVAFEMQWRKKQCKMERKKTRSKPEELMQRLYDTSSLETRRMESRKRRVNIAKKMVLREAERESDFRTC